MVMYAKNNSSSQGLSILKKQKKVHFSTTLKSRHQRNFQNQHKDYHIECKESWRICYSIVLH